jgi:hypothetical protein
MCHAKNANRSLSASFGCGIDQSLTVVSIRESNWRRDNFESRDPTKVSQCETGQRAESRIGGDALDAGCQMPAVTS